MDKLKGSLFAILSAAIFGLSPIYMKYAVLYGLNVITFSTLRAVLVTLASFLVCRSLKLPVVLKGPALKETLLLCGIGSGATGFLLALSYDYLSSGMATTIHFTYPVLVMLAGVLFYKEKCSAAKVAALTLGTAAIVLFTGSPGQLNLTGVALALASGCTYAFYTIGLGNTGVKNLHPFVVLFYSAACGALTSLGYGLVSRTLVFETIQMPGIAIMLASIPFYSFIAAPLFQLGVRYAGPTTTAILSTTEPLVSILAGMLMLGEEMDAAKLIGCIFILVGTLVTVAAAKEPRALKTTPVPTQPNA
ncbi:MAG: DMT family transporter [Candidatus Limiplasma sp.]|nr:DMT family transporter [Candidatus Limiplasma sp.]